MFGHSMLGVFEVRYFGVHSKTSLIGPIFNQLIGGRKSVMFSVYSTISACT